MIKKVMTMTAVVALGTGVCLAQTSSTTTSTTDPVTGSSSTTTTTTDATGTITDFEPDATRVLSTDTGSPAHYKFAKTVQYVTPDGKVVEKTKIKKNSKVRVHYTREGDDMLVDRVVVLDE